MYLCLCACCSVMIYTKKNVHLFPSEAVDKTPPTVHSSPAAQTYSKSAATPRNGNVNPASAFKSPGNKPSYQPGGPPGKGTQSEITPCFCHLLPLEWLWLCFCQECNIPFVQLLLSVRRGQRRPFKITAAPAVMFICRFNTWHSAIWDYEPCKNQRYSVNELRLLAFPRDPRS